MSTRAQAKAAATLTSPKPPAAGSKRKAKAAAAEPEAAAAPAAKKGKKQETKAAVVAAAPDKKAKGKQAVKPEPAPPAVPASKNPYKEAHFKSLDDVIDRVWADGSMLVVGLPSDNICDDEDEDEGEEEELDEGEDDDRILTAEQVAVLRHIIITPRRSKLLDEAVNRVTGGVESMFMVNTASGNQTVQLIAAQTKQLAKLKDDAKRFDQLFALTYAVKTYDHWLHDNEVSGPGGACDKAVKALGKAWRDVLKLGDAALGIDPEFTRPGIKALLGKFASVVEAVDGEEYRFAWE